MQLNFWKIIMFLRSNYCKSVNWLQRKNKTNSLIQNLKSSIFEWIFSSLYFLWTFVEIIFKKKESKEKNKKETNFFLFVYHVCAKVNKKNDWISFEDTDKWTHIHSLFQAICFPYVRIYTKWRWKPFWNALADWSLVIEMKACNEAQIKLWTRSFLWEFDFFFLSLYIQQVLLNLEMFFFFN